MANDLCWDWCYDCYKDASGFIEPIPVSLETAKEWIDLHNIAHNDNCQDDYPIEQLLSTATEVGAHFTNGKLIGCEIHCDSGMYVLNTPEFSGVDWEEHSCEC